MIHPGRSFKAHVVQDMVHAVACLGGQMSPWKTDPPPVLRCPVLIICPPTYTSILHLTPTHMLIHAHPCLHTRLHLYASIFLHNEARKVEVWISDVHCVHLSSYLRR